MKIRTTAALLLAFIAFSSFGLPSKPVVTNTPQQVTSFNFFRTHRQGAAISLSWSAATNGVDHFLVEKSYDFGEFYETVTVTAPGAGVNRFLDKGVYPGTIYYRVSAVDAAGNVLFSAIDAVRLISRG